MVTVDIGFLKTSFKAEMQKEPAQLFFVEPMECKEVKNVRDIPRTDDWQYELKYDGYRCVATVRKGEVTLYSRNGNVFVQFPNVETALGKLKATTLILDGEIVAHLRRQDVQTSTHSSAPARSQLPFISTFSICSI